MLSRRALLCSIAAGTALTLGPGFDAMNSSIVAEGFHRAAKRGVPLLVLVVPEDVGLRYSRGQALGEFLNFGLDDDVSRLHEVELVAATTEQLRVLVPDLPRTEPLMFLVDTSSVPSRTVALDAELGFVGDVAVDLRIEAIASLIRGALNPVANPTKRTEELRASVLSEAIPGSRWANTRGCGIEIEGESNQLMARCGMGHVEWRSQRFLHFFDVGV